MDSVNVWNCRCPIMLKGLCLRKNKGMSRFKQEIDWAKNLIDSLQDKVQCGASGKM